MAEGYSDFLDFYQRGPYAPYLQEHRSAGSAPVAMIEAQQPAGDFSDPPVGELLLLQDKSSTHTAHLDLGAGKFKVRGGGGWFALVAPRTATQIVVDGPHTVRGFAVPPVAILPIFESAGCNVHAFNFGRLHSAAFKDAFIEGLLDRMWQEATLGSPLGSLFADSAVQTLALALLRKAELLDAEPGAPRGARGGLAPWRLKKVTDFIDDQLAKDVSLADLAALTGLSTFHLCRAFKESTGLPPHRWRLARRVERACEMLENTDLPIIEVAAAVGYDDPGQLATVFRKALGMTPTQYRRERRS